MSRNIEDFRTEYGSFNLDYTALVESYGYEIVNRISLGSYQGDIIMVVSRGNEYGLLTTGYGSCSRCDALQACGDNIKELEKLREELCKSVIFESAGELIDRLDAKDWEGDYYSLEANSSEFREFLIKTKEELLLRHLAKI